MLQTNVPLVGLPYSKENTKQLFGSLLLEDPTFATEKFKKYQRKLKNETIVECSKEEEGWKIKMHGSNVNFGSKTSKTSEHGDPRSSTFSRKQSETIHSR